jgi:hypothetical protein
MVSCCGGGLAVRRAAAWSYVLGVKEGTCQSYAPDDGQSLFPKHVELILNMNKHCYLLPLVGFDFIAILSRIYVALAVLNLWVMVCWVGTSLMHLRCVFPQFCFCCSESVAR